MHYCIMIFTKEYPNDEKLSEVLKSFEENEVYSKEDENNFPQIMWDWWQVGGRYSGALKLKYDPSDEENQEKYKWYSWVKEPRCKTLFRSQLLEMLASKSVFYHYQEGEINYVYSMGARDGFIYVNGALVSNIINFNEVKCFGFIDIDGAAYAREWWNGNEWVKNENFDEIYKRTCLARKNENDCYATIVDIHD